jgi:integrase
LVECFRIITKSVGVAFRRACKELKIRDLRFHDLRHEATSRLLEANLTIEKVALVTGNKDWKMLRRYTNLRPEILHGKDRDSFGEKSARPQVLKDFLEKAGSS